jgi:hypothetical protein
MGKIKVILGLKAPDQFTWEEQKLIVEYLESNETNARFGKNIRVKRKKKVIYYAGYEIYLVSRGSFSFL